MKFHNSDLLWLLLLALVPILIHLLIRQRLPRVRWAAMTFLLAALRKNRKRILLETILLLVVRTAIVTAMVLVVLRPLAGSGLAWLGAEHQRRTSVLVLDDSASMAASDGVRTRFERAVARIDGYLAALPAGSDVAVLLGAGPPRWLVAQPTRDFSYVRDALARLSPRDSTGALGDAVDLARSLLSQTDTPAREIVIVSDCQKSDWDTQRQELAGALRHAGANAALFVLTVPETPAADIAVIDLSVAGGPGAVFAGIAATQWPTRVHVEISALHHSHPVETAVELAVDGQKVARQRVTVPPDRPLALDIGHQFRTAGEHTVLARCDPDLYDRDDSRPLVVRVFDRIRVLMIDGNPAEEPFASATGFLRAALWSMAADGESTATRIDDALFESHVVSASGLASLSVAGYPLILLADVAAMPSTALQQVKAAVREGAGLLVFAGPQTSPEQLAALLSEGGAGLLPVRFGPAIDLPPDAEPVGIALTRPLVPALAGFAHSGLNEALAQCGWRILRPIADLADSRAETWATLAGGDPILVSRRYGQGTVVYFGGCADRRAGEFPLSPAFVPLVQQLVQHALRGASPAVQQVGLPLEWPAPAGEATLIHPDGSREPAETYLADEPTAGDKRVILPATDRAGVYALASIGAAGVPVQIHRAAHLPDRERHLAMMPPDALRTDEAYAALRVVGPDQSLHAALRGARRAAELAAAAVGLVVALLVIELLLVRWFMPRSVDSAAMLREAMRL